MNDSQLAARLARQDAYWTGPRFIALLGGTLAIALAVIYFIACVRSGDFGWWFAHPMANDPVREAPISNW